MQPSRLQVRNLTTQFQTRQGLVSVIKDVSYDIAPGETLGVVGESGCGKSVTSLSVMGLVEDPGRIAGGSILFNGVPLSETNKSSWRKLRGGKMAMIFQEPMTALNPVLTVGEQIEEQILAHTSLSLREAQEKTVDTLSLVGIPSPKERAAQYPHQLSGGMRQRAMIAMALSCEPELLIADEPTTALDVTIQAQILELLQNLQEKFKMSIQFITHDLGVISEVSDRVMVMYGGHVCEVAPSADLFSNPQHPYTLALIQSRPKLGQKTQRLTTIEGSVPVAHQIPEGCPFVNRCSHSKDICSQSLRPGLLPLGGNSQHLVSCFFPVGSARG